MKFLRSSLVGLLMYVFAGGAYAQQSIQIVGTVPIICRVTAEPMPSDSGQFRFQEFCNSPGGYQVFLIHGQELAGAVVNVDGTSNFDPKEQLK